jgi:hypothetical protein
LNAFSSNTRVNDLASAFANGQADDGIASVSANRYFTVNQRYTINYDKSLGDHHFNILAGYEQYKLKYQYLSGSNTRLYDPFIGELGNAFGTSKKKNNSFTNNYMTEGFFGRVMYDYADKYFVNASLRRDASSAFAPGHRWGTFGSVGLAWQMNKEDFLKDVKWIDLLKLKVSYGSVGNDQLDTTPYANLQLQKVNPLNILQEIFLVHLPSQTDTSESTPTMTRGKCRRSITTKRGIYKVFVCIIVHYTTEETFCHIVVGERIVLLLACTKCITQLTNEWIVKTGI